MSSRPGLTRASSNEIEAASIPVTVGITAETLRLELVLLATALNAGVPMGSDNYTSNANRTVTVDSVQTDDLALQRVKVREIRSLDKKVCEISSIVEFVVGLSVW